MSAHSKIVIDKFCELCVLLHQSYGIRRFLFDHPESHRLRHPHNAHFFFHLSNILQDHWLHQLAKLHDPAVQGSHINLSVDYMIEYGQWDATTEDELKLLRTKMATLATPIKDARNKLLSHNDLAVLLRASELGAFEKGKDEEYFECLKQFATIVKGEFFLFDDLIQNDIDVFMDCWIRGMESKGLRQS